MKKQLKGVSPLEATDAYGKIQYYFFDFPDKEFSLNDLCSTLKISKTTANTVVKHLIGEGFLEIEMLGKLWRISCNQKHSYNITRKIPYHLQLIYESGVIEVIREKVPSVRTIILFGSYRKGDDNEKSDIDVAAEIISDDDYKIIEMGTVPQLGYRQNVPVTLHVFSRNKISLNLFANIANGIILEGFLEVRV